LAVGVLVDYILTAEQHNLQRLLTSSISLCAKYDPALVDEQTRIEEVSIETRYKIARKRNALFDEHFLNKMKSETKKYGTHWRQFSISLSEFPWEMFNLQPKTKSLTS
jgi:hypothetical protein